MKLLIYFSLFLFSVPSFAQPKTDAWLQQLLMEKGRPVLKKVLSQPDTFQYQVIYTRIDRDKRGRAHLTNYYLNVDRNRYFNPASTVKLPTALAALEKLSAMKGKGVDKYTDLVI